MVRGLTEALQEGHAEHQDRHRARPHRAARIPVLLNEQNKARHYGPYPYVQIQTNGPAVPTGRALLHEKHRVRQETDKEAQHTVGCQKHHVPRLVRRTRPDRESAAEETVVAPEGLLAPLCALRRVVHFQQHRYDGQGAYDPPVMIEPEVQRDRHERQRPRHHAPGP